MRPGFIDKKFGLPSIVSDHADMLRMLAKNSPSAVSGFWKNAQPTAKAMVFHHLALSDPQRLHEWLDSTPRDWWAGPLQKTKLSEDTKPAKGEAEIQGKYDAVAGGILHILFLNKPDTFLELLVRQPHLFQTHGVRYYVAEWCASLTPQQREPLQDLLLSQPVSWYSTAPERVLFLNSMSSQKHIEFALAAALAPSNAIVHPMLETTAPGITGCITIANTMLQDTKQKKAFIRKWSLEQGTPPNETFQLVLPAL